MPHYGFNFLWLFVKGDRRARLEPDCRALDFLAEVGLNFMRLPMDYRFWTDGTEYEQMAPDMLERIDAMVQAGLERGLHVCLNVHRAPGYCINRKELETHNLWRDEAAQDGLVFQWETFARRYAHIPGDALSFDLVNEPTGADEERPGHDALMRRTVEAIRAIDPDREIVLDGWLGGNTPLPELADLETVQSARGYHPFGLTHYRAPWCPQTQKLPEPRWPYETEEAGFWDRGRFKEAFAPWRELEAKGVRVHIGEFGCYSETPNDVALAWYADLLSVYREFGWGYSLWNFEGPFGIIDHGRRGGRYESMKGYAVDRELLDLYLANRVLE